MYVSAKTLVESYEGYFTLPTIIYTPDKIFRGEIPLFDIDFFNPSKDKLETRAKYWNAGLGRAKVIVKEVGEMNESR